MKQNVFMYSGVSASSNLINHSTLAECVKQEMKLEKMTAEPLPKFTNFISSLNGCCATLQRQYNNEKSAQLCTDLYASIVFIVVHSFIEL